MPQVFISYVKEDSEKIDRLTRALDQHGIDVWLDRHSVQPGERWQESIRRAIENGDYFVACFSEKYTRRSKTYMNEELLLAIEQLRLIPNDRSWFLPVLLDACSVPDRQIGGGDTLRSIQFLELYRYWDEGVSRLVAAIDPVSHRMQELLPHLKDKSARARIKAIDELRTLGPPAEAAAIPLSECLNDKNETVRAAAADALGHIGAGNIEVVKKLLLLSSEQEHSYCMGHASEALVKLGECIVPQLIEVMVSEGGLYSRSAFETLCSMGEVAAPQLAALVAKNGAEGSIDPIIALLKSGLGRNYLADLSDGPRERIIREIAAADGHDSLDRLMAVVNVMDQKSKRKFLSEFSARKETVFPRFFVPGTTKPLQIRSLQSVSGLLAPRFFVPGTTKRVALHWSVGRP